MKDIIIGFGVGFLLLIGITCAGILFWKMRNLPRLNLYDKYHGITPEVKKFFLNEIDK